MPISRMEASRRTAAGEAGEGGSPPRLLAISGTPETTPHLKATPHPKATPLLKATPSTPDWIVNLPSSSHCEVMMLSTEHYGNRREDKEKNEEPASPL